MEKKRYLDEATARVEQAKEKLASLVKDGASASAQGDNPEVKEISKSLDVIERQIDEVRRANEDGWHDIRVEIDNGLSSMDRTMKQALSRVV